MTIGSKLHMALTCAETLQLQIEQFGLDTENKQAKADFFRTAKVLQQQVVPVLQQRCTYTESQEPQYNVVQQATQQAAQSTGSMPQSAASNSQPPKWLPPPGSLSGQQP